MTLCHKFSTLTSQSGLLGGVTLCTEVYHPGEDASHGAGVLVVGAYMSDGLPTD